MGAWIEMQSKLMARWGWGVAPYMGAWIEIRNSDELHEIDTSLPTWERGLKF